MFIKVNLFQDASSPLTKSWFYALYLTIARNAEEKVGLKISENYSFPLLHVYLNLGKNCPIFLHSKMLKEAYMRIVNTCISFFS